jgi:hypothetical protein
MPDNTCLQAINRAFFDEIGPEGLICNIPAILLMFMIRSITGRLQGSLRCAPLAGSRTDLMPFPT